MEHQQKRIVMTIGNRGGIGKSTVLILVANFLRRYGQSVAAIDADTGNMGKPCSFGHFFGGKASRLDLRSPSDCDRLLELAVESPTDYVLVDLPANSERDLAPWFGEVADAKTIREAGVRITAVAPIVAEPGCALGAAEWMERMAERADYLVALNRRDFDIAPRSRDEHFREWHKVDVTGLQVEVIEVPHLETQSANNWMSTGWLPYRLLSVPEDPKEQELKEQKLGASGMKFLQLRRLFSWSNFVVKQLVDCEVFLSKKRVREIEEEQAKSNR